MFDIIISHRQNPLNLRHEGQKEKAPAVTVRHLDVQKTALCLVLGPSVPPANEQCKNCYIGQIKRSTYAMTLPLIMACNGCKEKEHVYGKCMLILPTFQQPVAEGLPRAKDCIQTKVFNRLKIANSIFSQNSFSERNTDEVVCLLLPELPVKQAVLKNFLRFGAQYNKEEHWLSFLKQNIKLNLVFNIKCFTLVQSQ